MKGKKFSFESLLLFHAYVSVVTPSAMEAEECSFSAKHIIQGSLRREDERRTLDRLLATYDMVSPDTRLRVCLEPWAARGFSVCGLETAGQTSLTLYSTGLASRCAGFKHFSEEATRSSQKSTECGGRRGGHSPELWVRNLDKWLYFSEVQLSLYKEEIVTSASGRGMEMRSVKASRRGVSHAEMLNVAFN